MANDWDDELNQGTDGGQEQDFSLDDIMEEFKDKTPPRRVLSDDTIPFPIIPKSALKTPPGRKPGRVVDFPTGKLPHLPPQPSKPEPDPGPELLEEVQPEEPEKVVDFPREDPEPPPEVPASDNPIVEGLNRLVRKADQYAGQMFAEEGIEDAEEVLRAERYIPGTDEEAPPEPRRERRRRPPPPPAPDLPPAELARRYQKGLKGLRMRTVLAGLTAFAALGFTLALRLGAPLPPEVTPQMQALILALALILSMLLGLDVLLRGLFRLLRLQMSMDTLLVFSCLAVLADAVTMHALDPREGQLPYCGLTCLAIWLTMRGTWLKQRGQRLSCRTAASAAQPYLVTLDDEAWNGRDTYAKWSGETAGFGRQMQAPDGAERVFHIACPLLFIACLSLSIASSVGREAPERILWCLSATLTAASSLSGALCYGIPWFQLSLRLSKSGAAIAGWDGVTATGSTCGILLSDLDLFPPGSVRLNGIKVFGDFPVDKVVSDTATLIRDSGSGLDKIFHDLLRAQGCVYRRATGLEFHEGGGLSAEIRGDQVLVGSGSFMQLMEIDLPQGLNVKNAVFCAIDGELAGVFALRYSLHGLIEPSLNALIRNRVTPVLSTRDFNLIPSMLQQRFKLPVERMEFPPVDRRVELSSPDALHSPILTAVLCREGVGPYSEAVVGAARLRKAVRGSAILASLGGAVGVFLAYYITSAGAYASLAPLNLLVFQVMWLVPTVLISGWVNKY